MKHILTAALVSMAFTVAALAATTPATVGALAPEFTAQTSDGKTIKLSDYKGKLPKGQKDGKYVVLQWHNEGCPYVVAQYESGNMQKLQKEWTAKGVVWLSIISSKPGKQGHVDAKGANDDVKKFGAAPTATILDPTSEIARQYGAKTTPHMFVINPAGILVYDGALDDKSTTDAAEAGKGKINYVSAALTDDMAGKPVAKASTKPYGCGVKY